MNKRKLGQLKEITSSLWNSYQHMCDVRRTGMQNKSNFLLIVISFLSTISISLFTHFDSNLFLIPFLLQLVSFGVLLKNFFIKEEFRVHWFESDLLLENLNKENFYQDLFADLKALEDDTWIYTTEVERNVKISSSILLLSLFSLLLALIFMYFNEEVLYFLTLILMIMLVLTLCVYYKKQPRFEYKSNYKKYKEKIDNWMKN